jgi:SAM-dependent methyltransferase
MSQLEMQHGALALRKMSAPTRSSLAAAMLASAALSFSGGAAAQFIPYVPTPQAMVDRMLEIAEVNARDFVIDLGCGDGRILVTAAERYGARGLGVDIDAQRIVEAEANAKTAGVSDKVTFKREDLFDTDISDASVLTLYLSLSVNIKLRPKILETMKPGSRVLSHHFNMGDWLPDRHEMVVGRMLYVWIVPAKVGGRWQLTYDGTQGGGIAFDLDQSFQALEGTAMIDGRKVPILEGQVTGDQVRFVIDRGDSGRTAFEGRLIDGRLKGEGWSAVRR